MRRALLLLVGSTLVGCAPAEEELAVASPASARANEVCVTPLPDTVPPAPAVADSFWTRAQEEEAARPPPRLARSISLGYAGDEPLAGGVMRDTRMETPAATGPGMTWQQWMRQPSWPPPREPGPNAARPRYGRW